MVCKALRNTASVRPKGSSSSARATARRSMVGSREIIGSPEVLSAIVEVASSSGPQEVAPQIFTSVEVGTAVRHPVVDEQACNPSF
jgi:hypothetical protein